MSMEREACFWTTTAPNYNREDRERFVGMDKGRRVVERFPQRGHAGDYDERRPARGVRFVRVVRHDGHVVPLLLTNAAAHLDPNTGYGQYQRAKARALGWFPVGACPCALLASGEMAKAHFIDEKVPGQRACDPGTYGEAKPCPHAVAEEFARKAMHAAHEAERMANLQDPTDKLIEAGREQTTALVEGLKGLLGKDKATR